MRRRTTLLGALACVALMGLPQSVSAQQSILLRYRPQPRTRLHTLWWSELTSTIREGAPGVPALDSITVEATTLHSYTSTVVGTRITSAVLQVSHDSTRARARVPGGAWRDLPDERARRSSARIVVDDRLRVTDVEVLDEDTLTNRELQQYRAVASGLEFALPEGAVAEGDSWASDIVVALTRPLGLEGEAVLEGMPVEPEVLARSTITLDSLVIRPTDTLAYLRVQGSFLPPTVVEGEAASALLVDITGAFGGSFIWSTGWNAFVSGALRTRATVTMERSEEVEQTLLEVTLSMDHSTRFQVRP